MGKIEIGDVVRFAGWVTREHFSIVLLRFNDEKVHELLQAQFLVRGTYHDDWAGAVAVISLRWRPVNRLHTILSWNPDTYVKTCYLEVYRD